MAFMWRAMAWIVWNGIACAQTSDPVSLGKLLFFDTRLSVDNSVSCATCHDPAKAFTDAHKFSPGVMGRKGNRHTPSLIARSGGTLQFWDGRSATLEQQVLEPIQNPNEMDMTINAVLKRLSAVREYQSITREALANSLAAYIRTIQSVDSPFDRFLRVDSSALNDQQREGLRLFRDKARCYICHSGDHFTDEQFHNTGVAWHDGQLHDHGRAVISSKTYHNGAFKTPTLREIANTAPYMHDGSLATLEDVLEFYDRGGNRNPWLDSNIEPLHLSEVEKQAIIAFLKALSGKVIH